MDACTPCKQAVWMRRGKVRTSLSCEQYENTDACAGVLREVLRVRMQDSVMKFVYACTFIGKPRGQTPAPPPEKRTTALPRLPACRALSRQIGKCIFRTMLAAFRTGRRQHLAFGEHTRLRRTKHAMKLCIGQSLPRGARRLACRIRIGPPNPNELVSACWGSSEFGSDILNGGLRPMTAFGPAGQTLDFPLPPLHEDVNPAARHGRGG